MENTEERFERPGQPELPVDYFLVVAHFEEWYVSREMAQAIEASLNQTPAPQWVMFVDLTGARVRSTNMTRSEEHTSELQSLTNLVCRLLLEKKKDTPRLGDERNVRAGRPNARP